MEGVAETSGRSPFDLSGLTAVVTGGGGGIGRGVAVALAQAGARTVVVGRQAEPLEETVSAVAVLGGTAVAAVADIAAEGAFDSALDAAIGDASVDILVNAAGGQLRKPALDIMPGEWDELLDVNLRSVFFCSQSAARRMTTGGSIINITSLTAFVGISHLSAYGASKGGVTEMAKGLAVEWAPLGIRVNCIAPGRIRTPMTEALFADDEVRESFLGLIPMGRGGLPEDIGGAAVFLSSQASSYITGQTLVVDGGWLASGGNPLR